jgi:exopolysaccharide production protein ExoZ
MRGTNRTRPLGSIQVLRAIAALAVVLLHIQGELKARGFDLLLPDLTVGAFGVDLFFVISGFIMVYATNRQFGDPGAAPDFLWRRLARIAPPYWVITTFFVATNLVARSSENPGYSLAYIAASYLFIPYPRFSGEMLPVFPLGWTLNYEMLFYVTFGVAIGLPRRVAVLAVGVALSMLVAVGAVTTLPQPLRFWSDPIILEFVFGMLIAELYLQGLRVPRVAGAALIVVGCLGAMSFVPGQSIAPHLPRGLSWGLAAAVILAGATLVPPLRAGLLGAVFARLGDASYSLYLVHLVVITVSRGVLLRSGALEYVGAFGYAMLLLLGSIAAAMLMFRFVERPVTRALNGRKARDSRVEVGS